MKIEFTREEVEQILLEHANRVVPNVLLCFRQNDADRFEYGSPEPTLVKDSSRTTDLDSPPVVKLDAVCDAPLHAGDDDALDRDA